MLLVKIFYTNGETDLKYVLDVSEVCLDGVSYIKIIRNEKAA
jgi:hypothetical protein